MSLIIFGNNLLQNNLAWTAIINFLIGAVYYPISWTIPVDSLVFFLPLGVLLTTLVTFFFSMHFHFRQVFATLMSLFWSCRTLVHLANRIINDQPDSRLDKIRNSKLNLFGFFALGEVLLFGYSIPTVLLCSYYPQVHPSFNILDALAILLWLSGMLLELVADIQLNRFRRLSFTTFELVCKHGTWRYMRHPNYIGNVMQVWGIFFFCLSVVKGWEWLVLLCPLTVSFLLLFVTGIPPAEKALRARLQNDEEYKQYLAQTGKYLPITKMLRGAREGMKKRRGRRERGYIEMQPEGEGDKEGNNANNKKQDKLAAPNSSSFQPPTSSSSSSSSLPPLLSSTSLSSPTHNHPSMFDISASPPFRKGREGEEDGAVGSVGGTEQTNEKGRDKNETEASPSSLSTAFPSKSSLLSLLASQVDASAGIGTLL